MGEPPGGARIDDHERLVGSLDAAVRGGRGTVVFVDGEPGIGKTRLLEDVARSAATSVVVLQGAADLSATGRPFDPLLDALAAAVARAPDEIATTYQKLGSGDVNDASTEARERRSPLQMVPDERVRLVDGLAALLLAWSDHEPLVLMLDDVQWIDESSLAVMSLVARSIEQHRFVMIAAMRPSPLPEALGAFVAQQLAGGAERITLGPLAPSEVAALVADTIGAPPGPRLMHVADAARGNPFLLLELLSALDHEHQLVFDSGIVEASSSIGLALPSTPARALIERMAAVRGDARHVVQVAAVLGRPFSLTELSVIMAREVTDLLPLVETLVEARTLEEHGTTLRFRHDLVREAVLSTMSDPVVAAVHLQAARALAASGSPAALVAPHFLRGAVRGDVTAASWLRSAATEIVHRDPASAADLLERAHQLLPATSADRDAVGAELVDACFWCGRLERVVDVAGELLARPQPADREAQLHETLAKALGLLGRPAEAVGHMSSHPLGENPWGLGLTAMMRLFAMDLDGSLRDSQRAHELLLESQTVPDPWAETMALSVQSFVHNIRGYHVRAAELAEGAVAAADRSAGLEAHRLVPLVFHGFALHSAGQEAASVAAWRRGEQLAEELGAAWSAPFFHYGRALAHWDDGNWGDLLAEADAALEFARCHGTALAIGFACAVGAAAHLFQRRPDVACKLLDEGDELLGRGGLQYGADWLAWIRALHLEASGDSVGALELLDGAWQVASALRAEAALSLFGPDLIRLHLLAGDRANAERVLAHLENAQHDTDRTTVDGSARMWRAALDHDLAGLAEVRAMYAAFPRPVQVVLVDEAAVIGAMLNRDATGARLRLRDVVAGADQLDCPGIADRAERAAAVLGLPAKTERRPARPVSGWGSLTDTERAVARLVASGSSNVAVADALGISRRTVESHLYHTFTKLSVRNRTELAIVAVRELGEISRVSSSSGC